MAFNEFDSRIASGPPDPNDWRRGGGGGDDGSGFLNWLRGHPHRAAIVVIGLLLLCAILATFRASGRLALFLLILAVLVYMVWNTPRFLRRRQVIDRWDTLVPDGNGQVDQIFGAVHNGVREVRPPHVSLDLVQLSPGVWRGIQGETRPFIVAQNETNGRIESYQMFINVRDYGNTLQTSWYLAYLPTIWQRMRGQLGLGLDLFDEQDLRAYVTVVHRALVEAVVDLVHELGKDIEVTRSSKGFLGVS